MPFQPGQSGNPNGRPRLDPKIKAMFQARGEQAFEVISGLLTDDDPKVRLSAAQTLLDRAYGKVPQSIVGGDDDDAPVRIINEVVYRVIDALPKPNEPASD